VLGITAALLLQTSMVAADLNYAAAHKRTVETGEPLVVLVGADWCPACQSMKQSVIPQAKRAGLLNRVAFAVVNTDREPALARQLMRGSSIPQLIMYQKSENGWRRRQLTGSQSLDSLESFLAQPSPPADAPKVSDRKPTEGVMGR
jgi:thioredoxin-like negative regulator of GroEL